MNSSRTPAIRSPALVPGMEWAHPASAAPIAGWRHDEIWPMLTAVACCGSGKRKRAVVLCPDFGLIDDTEHWHAVTAATVDQCPGWQFAGFIAEAGMMAYHVVGSQLRQQSFCDYYLDGRWRGDVVCQELYLRSRSSCPIDGRAFHCLLVRRYAAGADIAKCVWR